jgi:hypothetical protein
MRTGRFRQAYVRSPESHTIRALLAARERLVGMRCRLEDESQTVRSPSGHSTTASPRGPG